MSAISQALAGLPGQFSVSQINIRVAAGTTPTKLLSADANRWGFIVGPPKGDTGTVVQGALGLGQGNTTAANGIVMPAGSSIQHFTFRQFGSLVQQEIWGISTSAGAVNWTIWVINIQQ